MWLAAISPVTSAFPTPSPENGSTRDAASPTNRTPFMLERRGFILDFLRGEPNGSCQPFAEPGTISASAKRSLNIG